MDAGQFTNTAVNMVQVVTNIIEGYGMGSMRALAQEPVQNALDAVRDGQGTVKVEYRLLWRETPDGRGCHLLTVTDTGTTGLRGRLVSNQELERRNFKLAPNENWAAFEAQGYTKENEDALGSRGQGKAAFLYHSQVPGETRRMAMLYETLTEDDEHRLGMRFARPIDQVRTPPHLENDAKSAIQLDAYQLDDDVSVPLGLEPLREIGTRVIVPFLDENDAREMRPRGELSAWLQRCWWRAIQTGKLEIRVVDEVSGEEETIRPPTWWRAFPRVKGNPADAGEWVALPDGGRACIWGDLEFGEGHNIRRLVMLQSDGIDEDEIVRALPEYAGIQVLRGAQWIETRGAREEFGDYIPRDKRPGFRGYVEFDQRARSLLRAAENTQHDGFDARGKKGEVVRSLREILDEKVREFSAEMGWDIPQAVSQQQVSQREQQTHSRFLETFLNPNGRQAKSSKRGDEREGEDLLWDCRLALDYPDPKSARVDWGQSISRVYVEVGVEPSEAMSGSADVVLEWVDSSGKNEELVRKEEAIRTQWGVDRVEEKFELGDWQVLRGKASADQQQIGCPEPGECRLRAAVEYRGQRVKSSARSVYVESEPPAPPEKNPVTLSINVTNATDGEKKRIDHGEVVQIDIFSRNRLPDAASFCLTASAEFENDPYARRMPIELDSTPAGNIADKKNILTLKRQLLDPQQPKPPKVVGIPQVTMPDSSGRYTVRAELEASAGFQPKPVSGIVCFQQDPSSAKGKLPFSIDKVDNQDEIWKLNSTLDQLSHSGKYPLYTEMKEVQKQRRALQGRLAFIAEISANGLLDWAMRPKILDGNESNFDQLYDEQHNTEDGLWEKLNRCLERLSRAEESPIEFDLIRRETVAVMLEIFAKEHD